MGFKMQPLSYITLENDPLDFKDINVMSTCVLNIRTSVSKIDLSKFDIPINSAIYIKHFNEILPAFKDKRYIQVDGKPLFETAMATPPQLDPSKPKVISQGPSLVSTT